MQTAEDGWRGAKGRKDCGREEETNTLGTGLLRGIPGGAGECAENKTVQSPKTGQGDRWDWEQDGSLPSPRFPS